MRAELFYNPALLIERLAVAAATRRRRRRLRGTVAEQLMPGHLDTMELLDIAASTNPAVFYDVGAEVGTWSLLAKALFPRAQVHAFEPLPAHHERFAERLRGVPDVTLHRYALGAGPSTALMNVATAGDASSLLDPTATAAAEGVRVAHTQSVPVVALDDLVAELGLPAPDLIKADVQGYEIEVFRGATRCLRQARFVIAEVSFREIYRGQPLFADVAAFLAERGFRAEALAATTRLGAPVLQTDVLFSR